VARRERFGNSASPKRALGYDEKHAAQVVERLLKGIRTRPDEDSALKTLQKMLSS
jgi:hypothetical protein